MKTHLILSLFVLSALSSALAQEKPASPAPGIKLEATADYIALRVSGTSKLSADTWQWRVLPVSDEDQVAWSTFAAPGPEGAFKLATPMPAGGWHRVEVRALNKDQVIGSAGVTRPTPAPFEMVTAERIAALPQEQSTAWQAYLSQSQQKAKAERDQLAAECRGRKMPVSKPAPNSREEFEFPSKVEGIDFGNAEYLALADTVLSYQTPSGAWSKAVDYRQGPRQPGTHWTTQSGDGWHYCGTLDNRSTTEQIKFLARVFAATQREDCKKAAERGLEWIYAAQFPNGGWPQVYPLEPGYHEAITLNDDAITHVLELLLAVNKGTEPFGFVDDAMKKRAAEAFDRGVQCLLDCQVTVKGARTVWCAQHDPLTLAPVQARLKEPPSLSGAESTALLKFLMRQGPVSAPVRTAIEAAVAWLEAHKITDLRKTTNAEGKTDYVKDPASSEVLWARFYDVQTSQPLFAGAQDGIIYTSFHDMAAKNKVAYDYFTTKPLDLLTKEVPRWKKRLAKEDK